MKKKTVKKMLSAALVGAMVLSLAACGSKGDVYKRQVRGPAEE